MDLRYEDFPTALALFFSPNMMALGAFAKDRLNALFKNIFYIYFVIDLNLEKG